MANEIFKRRSRHNNTPAYALLIITNYVVCCALFTLDAKLNWFFFLTLAALAAYNYYNIRKNIEEYIKPIIIAYIVSLAGLVLLFFLASSHS